MSFCTGCGKPLQQGARFCAECGTPVQDVAAQASAANTVAQSAAAVRPAQVQAPLPVLPESSTWERTSGSGPSQGLIVLGVVLVLMIVAAVGGIFYMRSENSGSAAVAKQVAAIPESLPATNSAVELGNALNLGSYPGATPIPLATFQGENVFAAFLTRDTPDQVIGFYKVRFPVAETSALDSGTQLVAALANGEHIRIVAVTKPNGTEVKIARE